MAQLKIKFLTNDFYIHYSDSSEILSKKDRPYIFIILKTTNCMNIDIPLRSNIKHKHAFFTDTLKSKGLDYSKTVLISNKEYIDIYSNPQIDAKEYSEIKNNIHKIKIGIEKYIKDYSKRYRKQHIAANRVFCQYSSLQYFHKELNL